jgi:hypothetical protein
MLKAPKIVFNAVSKSSLKSAFYYCTHLTDASQIEISTVANNSYQNMFQYCYDLISDGLPKFTL